MSSITIFLYPGSILVSIKAWTHHLIIMQPMPIPPQTPPNSILAFLPWGPLHSPPMPKNHSSWLLIHRTNLWGYNRPPNPENFMTHQLLLQIQSLSIHSHDTNLLTYWQSPQPHSSSATAVTITSSKDPPTLLYSFWFLVLILTMKVCQST